jgi:hypothetical protein
MFAFVDHWCVERIAFPMKPYFVPQGYAIAIVAKTNTARYAAVFLIAAGV